MMGAATDGQFDFGALKALLADTPAGPKLYQAIVDAPFEFKTATAFIFLGIIVLLLVNEEAGTIDRIALSDTSHADATKEVSVKPFNDIRVPLGSKNNLIARVIRGNAPEGTADWAELFAPELTPEQSRINQANGGIGYSMVYPLSLAKGGKGAMIFSYYQYPEAIAEAQTQFMQNYIALVSKRLGA
jgi:hypothetical protein